jgi:hypothetical protein
MSIASMSIASVQRNNSTDRHSVGSGAPSVDQWERHNVVSISIFTFDGYVAYTLINYASIDGELPIRPHPLE